MNTDVYVGVDRSVHVSLDGGVDASYRICLIDSCVHLIHVFI